MEGLAQFLAQTRSPFATAVFQMTTLPVGFFDGLFASWRQGCCRLLGLHRVQQIPSAYPREQQECSSELSS